jgi:hypothetical protein
MIGIQHIAKDLFELSQGIATKHFYPKYLFKRVVQGNRDKSCPLKGVFPIKFMKYNN